MTAAARPLHVHLIAGARPNFVKIAPLWHVLSRCDWCRPFIIHTGQHYDLSMSDWMFRDLMLPPPDFHLGALTGSHARVTGSVIMAYEKLCLEESRPDWVIVVGDVDSTIACTLTAKKLGFPVAHLEAGLRSLDRGMPEELNRILTDSIADLLWTPSIDGDNNLLSEGVSPERIEFVGNIMIDALFTVLPTVDKCDVAGEIGFVPDRRYGVVTLHRPSNVDDPAILGTIVRELCEAARKIQLIFPLHPRTKRALNLAGLEDQLTGAGVRLIPSLSYIPFIALIRQASFLLTDSGGVQEETSVLGVPCLTLRASTERPVTTTQGTNRLITPENLLSAVSEAMVTDCKPAKIKFWDGNTAQRVADSLRNAAGKVRQ